MHLEKILKFIVLVKLEAQELVEHQLKVTNESKGNH